MTQRLSATIRYVKPAPAKTMKLRFFTCLMALGLCLASAAHAQNILLLTTGARNDSPDIENNYMGGIVQEFAAPLSLATCNTTPQTVIDPVSGLSKTVTCNATELVNGAAMSPSLFDPGYDLLVIASAYSTIDPADWPVIEAAIQTRKVRGAVLFIDTVNAANANQVKPLLDRALGLTGVNVLGNGTSAGSAVNAHALNTAADGAGDFSALSSLTLGHSYFPYTQVPAANALYLGYGAAGPVTSGTTSSVGVLVPSTTSHRGAGACLFGANDIGWAGMQPANSGNGWAANNGKVGVSFLKSFNNPSGPCRAAIATPPELDIAKTTTAASTALPFTGSTVPYTVTVSNTSAVLANNVMVTDSAPAGLSFGPWTCTVINAGAAPASVCPSPLPSGNLSASLNLSAGAQLQFTVDALVVDNQLPLTNVAALTLPAGATCAGNRTPCDASVAFSPLPAVLDITKSTTTSTLALPANNSTVPYTVTVRNASTGSASNVALTDAAPAGLAFGAWACTVLNAGTGQASVCPAALASGDLSTLLNLSSGAQLQFTTNATVLDNQLNLTNVATLGLPAGASCVADRAPCDARVQFAGGTPASNTAKPVPGLGGLGVGLLCGLLGWLGLRTRRTA